MVRKRHVFYLCGFDPKGPAYYHALYAEEAQKQAAVNVSRITIGPARRRGRMALCFWAYSAFYLFLTKFYSRRMDDIFGSTA